MLVLKKYLITLFSLPVFYILLSTDLPFASKSIVDVLLSFCFFCFSVYNLAGCIFNYQYLNPKYIFNFVWGSSISLALLSLSSIQQPLSIPYIIYIINCIAAFNIGCFLSNRRVNDIIPSSTEKSIADIKFYNSSSFKFLYFVIFIICCVGYAYEMYVVGYIPIFQSLSEGFYNNRAGFLSFIHYFATSLGPISGFSLAIFMLNRSKLHLIIFIVAFLLSIGLLAKNVLFLFVFFFLGTYLYFRQVSVTKIISLGFLFVAIALISSNLRLGNSEYILIYSRMGNLEIPAILAWYNTYFAVNITHLDTYFTNGYTPTYGLSSMSLLTSLLLLKGPVQELLGNQIIHFNGLGGGVNVNSFLKTYLSDFGVMSSLVLVPLGYLVSHIYKLYMNRKGYFYMLLHCGLIYAVTFSVFGDFFNRLMVYIGIAFILLPIYLTKKLAQKDTRKVIYHEKS